ncbi:MAG: metallophosphoesterase family protein [Spirochaetales bacterium]|nr:metallophosphoesterase family protein [Spirochaetales bacterium]
MKILCISDYKDQLVYSSNIKTRFKDIDLIISCGDLPLDYYDFIISSLNRPLVFVFGNHNLKRIAYYDNRYRMLLSSGEMEFEKYRPCGGRYINGKVVTVKGLLIAGIGGSMRYNNGMNQFSECGMYFFLFRLIPVLVWNRIIHGRFLDILVTHAPPYRIHDCEDVCHRGFKAFLWFMKVFKPAYLIHGHIHLYTQDEQRVSTYLNTTVVNAFKHCVIDTGESNE